MAPYVYPDNERRYVAIMPLHAKFTKMLGGRPKTASVLMTLIALAILLIPTIQFFGEVVEDTRTSGTPAPSSPITAPAALAYQA